MKVVSLEPNDSGRSVTVYFDNSRRISVSSEVAVKAGLKVGQTLDRKALADLRTADRLEKALETAYRYLEYRPRSEKEVRDRLRRGGYSGSIISRVVVELRRGNLIDDRSFSRWWCEGRATGSPRGKRLIMRELQARGVDRKTAEEAVDGLDDEAAAYEIGRKKARSLVGLDSAAFREKLGSYLHRRGFDYEVVTATVKRVWRELSS
ncbi:MAG: RecX family transcriptional regulator [Dehalococcoidia bacterium]|nr:RecX family transcriptional regulator [Dehalococcoidia bacterium]